MNLSFLVFLNCACVGICTGFVSDISYGVKKLLKNNYFVNVAIDFIVFFIGATFVFVVSSNMNNNIFALYELLGFILGVILEKISCSNLIAKIFDMLYNGFIKLANKIKLTRWGKCLSK